MLWAITALVVLSGCESNDADKATVPAGYSASPAATPASQQVPWPAPPNPLELAKAAGLTPDVRESFTYHVHAHLDLFVNGKRVPLPGGLGIDTTDPEVKRSEVLGQPAFGGIKMCSKPCISPLHTHDVTGLLHVEAPQRQPFTLGQFFTHWDVPLTESCIGGYCRTATSIVVFVDGKRHGGDPSAIELIDRKEIAILIGSPPKEVPSTYDFSNA